MNRFAFCPVKLNETDASVTIDYVPHDADDWSVGEPGTGTVLLDSYNNVTFVVAHGVQPVFTESEKQEIYLVACDAYLG